MIMADVFKILFLILGLLICSVSYWLIFAALFAPAVGRAQQALAARPVRVFLIGALSGVPLVLIGIALTANGAGPIKMVGVTFLMLLTTTALFGSTALARMVGQGLGNPQAPKPNGALILRGGAALSIACVLPLVGWFLLLPVILLTGFGAAVHVIRRRVSLPSEMSSTAGAVQA